MSSINNKNKRQQHIVLNVGEQKIFLISSRLHCYLSAKTSYEKQQTAECSKKIWIPNLITGHFKFCRWSTFCQKMGLCFLSISFRFTMVGTHRDGLWQQHYNFSVARSRNWKINASQKCRQNILSQKKLLEKFKMLLFLMFPSMMKTLQLETEAMSESMYLNVCTDWNCFGATCKIWKLEVQCELIEWWEWNSGGWRYYKKRTRNYNGCNRT